MPDATDRVTVTTYVPAEQRKRWSEEADRLDMSQSEFVRTMVQAGRRGFSLDPSADTREEPNVAGSNPRGNVLRTPVLETLRERGPLPWGALVDSLTTDMEADLEAVLNDLRDDGRIRHSPRTGEFAVVEDGDGD